MNKNVSKYGTDSRYPVWAGIVIDPDYFNAILFIILMLNWGLVGYSLFAQSLSGLIFRMVIALVSCIGTMWLIRHKDLQVRVYTRIYACGLPALIILFTAYRLLSL